MNANQVSLIPCDCGEVDICLCGRCKKCGKTRAKTAERKKVQALVEAAEDAEFALHRAIFPDEEGGTDSCRRCFAAQGKIRAALVGVKEPTKKSEV